MALTHTTKVSNHLEPWLDLSGKVVLITGASSGLGRDFCLNLAKAGCKIIAAARRVDKLKSLCDGISSDDVKAVAVELDVTADGKVIELAINEAWNAFGWIDVLINNAGVRGNVLSPLDISENEWNHTLKTNLTGTWLVSKYVCRRMRDSKREGSVINISSAGGLERSLLHGGAAYAASKGATDILSKTMALELGSYKIRVNSIAPRLFESEITQGLYQKAWLNEVAQKVVPLGALGTSDPELTSLIRYLIHDTSAYVSGNVFIVDAGATLPGIPIFSRL